MGRKLRESVREARPAYPTVTQYSYDAMGRLDCTAVRMNPAVFGSLPAAACTPARRGATAPTESPATSTTPPASACSCARASARRRGGGGDLGL